MIRSQNTNLLILLVLFMLGAATTVTAQQSPFTGGPPRESAPASEGGERTGVEAHPIFRGQPLFPRMNAILREQQRTLNARFAELLQEHTNHGTRESSRGVIPVITLVAFLYGLIHAALPGHRKVLLVSYFFSTPAKVRHAVSAGVAVAILHSGAAAVVILSAYYLLRTSLSAAMDSATIYLQAITAAFVLVVGIVILALKVREALRLRHGHEHEHEHEHEHNKADEAAPMLRLLRRRIGLLPAIVLSAIVPCPGSAMILLFALSLGVVTLGLYAVAVFSLGMAVTLSTVLVVTVLSKKVLFRALDGRFGEALHLGIEGLGGLVMVLFGVVLLMPYL